MQGLQSFLSAVLDFATTPILLFHVLWATLLGITVGALPGLTATLGVALLTTLTFHMDSQTAILVLVCMYVGAIYGGSRSAILLNIPGTPASAATSLDGFPLARAGHAGRAMGLATSGSFLGSLIGMVALAVVAPVLGEVALSFRSPEFFWLALFGVLISGQITTTGDTLKGWISGVLGLLGGDGRAGGDPRLPAVQLRLDRPVGRDLAAAGAGRRVRVRRDHRGDEGAGLRDRADGERPGAAEGG